MLTSDRRQYHLRQRVLSRLLCITMRVERDLNKLLGEEGRFTPLFLFL